MKKESPFLPDPRSYFGVASLLWGITWLPFTLLWSWLVASMQQKSFGEILPLGLTAGFFFGLFFGLWMGFHLRGTTLVMNIADHKDFVARINIATSELGYFPVFQTDGFLVYKPSFQAGLVAGKLSVQMCDEVATVVGPRIYVQKLFKRIASS